ncbi:Alpha/Beta hydrolase protein [Xylogone sp. PMI_703]|nr:Alpha/Beta hydrolase protein [Xylogone sp. PMI_703]
MAQKPTLVFVPGAWHNILTWNKVTALLEAQGYKCVRVALASTSGPEATFLDDITAVRNAIQEETANGSDVVIVVHSYGGHVGSSAIKGLTRPKPGDSSSAKDSSNHVIGYAMLATGFTITGVSFLEAAGGKPHPFWRADVERGFAALTVDARELFYHDLPLEEGNYYVNKLEQHSLKSLAEGGEYAYSGWKDVPVWFLATTDDKALPIEVQRAFVETAQKEGGDITIREIETSHSPMLSKPKETVDFILEAVEAFTG